MTINCSACGQPYDPKSTQIHKGVLGVPVQVCPACERKAKRDSVQRTRKRSGTTGISRDELLQELRAAADRCERPGGCDAEIEHGSADDLLIRYINDQDVTDAYERITRWYA